MLGLPKNTELNKQLPKKAIYTKFQMNNAAKEQIDSDISKIVIVNEISPAKINIDEGENIKAFYVIAVTLKKKDFKEKNIITISKIIPQNMLMLLEYEDEAKLAVYHSKLMQTEWQPKEDLSVELKGLNLDVVWENIIKDIEGGNWSEDLSLDENLEQKAKNEKLQKEIAKLERQAKAEKQPKKKFEIVQKINKLKNELGSRE